MCGDEAHATAAAAVRTRRGAGTDDEGVVPLLRAVAACVRPRVSEEGRPTLGGWSILLVTWQPQKGG